MENNQEEKLTPEQLEQFELARKLSEEVVNDLNFPDIKEAPREYVDLSKNYRYKIVDEFEVEIYAQMMTEYGYVNIRFSLTRFAYDLLGLSRLLFSNETAHKVLNHNVIEELRKRNIDILTLLNIENEDIEEVIKYNTKEILKIFVNNIPLFTRSTIIDAFGHSKIGYLQNIVKPMLREHWAQLGLPKDFSLITNDELDQIRQYYTDRRRWQLGDKRQMLNWGVGVLPDEYEILMKHYSEVKKEYLQLKKSFEILRRRSTYEDWKAEWREICLSEFSNFNSRSLQEIEDKRPFELALIHLADHYGVNEETIRKKILKQKKRK